MNLVAAYRRAHGDPVGDDGEAAAHGEADEALAAALNAAWTSARARAPALGIDALEAAAFLGAQADGDLAGIAGDDLVIACGCLRGDAGALRAFEAEVMPAVALAVARVSSDPAFVAEVAAAVRVKLLVGNEGRPAGLGRYGGRGPLRSFAMVVAMRAAVDAQRTLARRREIDIVDVAEVLGAGPMGIDVSLRAQVHGVFVAALKDALSRLSVRERTVLRLFAVDGVSAEALGRMYRVHRSTTTRWIADAREQVTSHVQASLKDALRLKTEDLASVTRVMGDGLGFSLTTFLQEGAPTESAED